MTPTYFLPAPPILSPASCAPTGPGAGMTTPFMEAMAGLLADRNIATVRFEFAYMAARRQWGSRKPPPKAERLMDEYRSAVAGLPDGSAAADWRQVHGRAGGKPRSR